MTRLTFTALLALAAVSAAHAGETKILKNSVGSLPSRAQLASAATEVCRAALKHDPFGDYGTLDECIENTLQGVHPRTAALQPEGTRISSSR